MTIQTHDGRRVPQPGDFGIKPGGGTAMWWVRLGTFSRYGHAAEVIGTDFGKTAAGWLDPPRVRIVEAAPGGVRKAWVGIDEFRWSTGGPLDDQLTDEIRNNLVRRAVDQVGRDYDWPSIGKFLIRFFYAKYRGYSPDHPDEKLFCSELIVWNRDLEGIHMFPGKAPGDIAPGELADFCPPSPNGKP